MDPWPTRLKKLRSATGLSQAQVANHFKIKPSSVAQWETGRSKPTVDKIARLATLYQVSINTLCGDDIPIIGVLPEQPASKITADVEHRMAVGKGKPQRGDFVDDLDELALLEMFRGLSFLKKAALFAYLGAVDMPSLRKLK